MDVLSGVAAARLAERVLDFINARRIGDGDDDNNLPGACTALRSFSGDTEVLLADGTAIAIAHVEVGDVVFAHDPGSEMGSGLDSEQLFVGRGGGWLFV